MKIKLDYDKLDDDNAVVVALLTAYYEGITMAELHRRLMRTSSSMRIEPLITVLAEVETIDKELYQCRITQLELLEGSCLITLRTDHASNY